MWSKISVNKKKKNQILSFEQFYFGSSPPTTFFFITFSHILDDPTWMVYQKCTALPDSDSSFSCSPGPNGRHGQTVYMREVGFCHKMNTSWQSFLPMRIGGKLTSVPTFKYL